MAKAEINVVRRTRHGEEEVVEQFCVFDNYGRRPTATWAKKILKRHFNISYPLVTRLRSVWGWSDYWFRAPYEDAKTNRAYYRINIMPLEDKCQKRKNSSKLSLSS